MVERGHLLLTRERFDALLRWLDPDRDQAAERYEDIRQRLVKIFAYRGCDVPEDLAEDTMDRVAFKVGEISDSYVGNPDLYFYGVAKLIYREYLRRRWVPSLVSPNPPREEPDEQVELRADCLESCMQCLSEQDRDMLLEYYREDGHARIEHRRKMADRLGVPVATLRVRAHRVRINLEDCLRSCVAQRLSARRRARIGRTVLATSRREHQT